MFPVLRSAAFSRLPRTVSSARHVFPPVISTAPPAHTHNVRAAVGTPHASPAPPVAAAAVPLFRAPAPAPGVDRAVALASEWAALPQKPALASQLSGDDGAVSFVMKFVDWVMRPDDPKVAAVFLKKLVAAQQAPSFLSAVDRALVSLGGVLAPLLPSISIPAARARMQAMVSPFVGAVESMDLNDGTQKNVNLLGEAVLGDVEATRRRREAEDLLAQDGVDYVSVKVSGVTSQLNKWDFDGSLERVLASMRPLFEKAAASNPRVLINLDMEEYHDLEITIAAFTRLLEEPRFQDLDAGIVLQAYLPDSYPVLQELVRWANNRPGKGEIKIRLVKGANLAMEKVDAAVRGWEQAPYASKSDTDANYLRCLDWVFTQDALSRVRIGVASHNLFLLAYAKLLAEQRGVTDRVGFEMLRGMTPSHTPTLANQGHGMLLYTPVCRQRDFDSAIAYLFRRFEEASSEGNFLRSLPSITADSPTFRKEEQRFRTAAAKRSLISAGPRREQPRPAPASHMSIKGGPRSGTFVNEPDSDPCLLNVRTWAAGLLDRTRFSPASDSSWVRSEPEMRAVLSRARQGAALWAETTTPGERRTMLQRAADALAARRGDLINAMVFEAGKTVEQADPEVSEAIDFANYYALHAEKLPDNFESMGVVAVLGPWNFPTAITAGGVFSSLAAGNAAVLKPSPATPRCAEIMVECAWEAGVPRDVLQFVQCPENEVGKHLVTEADAVILTGSSESADLFRSWKKDIRLFAETSGKNALVISPAADIDLAVADLAYGAFSHTGQKCSASSLAICIGDVYESERFRRQLKDAVESIKVGQPWDIATVMGPTLTAPEGKLRRALTTLEDGEEWLVEPRCLDSDGEGRLWTPGVRLGVKPGSWFHQTEVFGPVLGVMHARDLDEALEMQNSTAFGLTAGLHSLDHDEIEQWTDRVEAGNLYVNRGTTGAIVQRQAFGGWKTSCVGPGAKAGGPNYVAQLGDVRDTAARDERWLAAALVSDEAAWDAEFSREVDATQLFCEKNSFRYRAVGSLAIRVGADADEFEVARVRAAAGRCGVKKLIFSRASEESAADFLQSVRDGEVERVRTVGSVEQQLVDGAADMGVRIANEPVVGPGRVEMLHYLREQSICHSKHRFGNLLTSS